MELALRDMEDVVTVTEDVFNCTYNRSLVHQVIVSYLSHARQGTRAQKNRSEVSGSNKKPWRQKGTGRARSGSTKSPIWRSGGVTFSASPKKYTQKVNKKMYRGALRCILSELLRQDQLVVMKDFSLELPKTKFLVHKLKDMFLENVLIIIDKIDIKLTLAARNLHKVHILNASNIDPVNLVSFKKIVITVNAIKKIEEMLK